MGPKDYTRRYYTRPLSLYLIPGVEGCTRVGSVFPTVCLVSHLWFQLFLGVSSVNWKGKGSRDSKLKGGRRQYKNRLQIF